MTWVWIGFTIVNAALLGAAWWLSTSARDLLAEAQQHHRECDDILADSRRCLAEAKWLRRAVR